MCGRFHLHAPVEEIADAFDAMASGLEDDPALTRPRYNICPTQSVLTIRTGGRGRALSPMRWGFLPQWYKTPTDGPLIINARAEGIADKPAFRVACRETRCLIPATGFYEWRAGDPKPKTPFAFDVPAHPLFAFAGVWRHWSVPGHDPVDTCAIVTCAATDALKPIHHRMPVIIDPADHALWLGEAGKGAATLMRPASGDAIVFREVGRAVSNARSDGPSLLDAVRPDP